MKKVFIILFLFVSFFGFSQKIKLKDGIIFVDKVEYVKFKEDKVSRRCYIVSNLKGEDVLYIRGNTYHDPATVKPTTPGHYSSGDVFYFEVLSADLNTIYFENRPSGSPFNSLYAENTISNLYNGEAINADGTLNIQKLEMLSKKLGFEYSKKRDEINSRTNNTQTVIIKEGPRSGVNINIGR